VGLLPHLGFLERVAGFFVDLGSTLGHLRGVSVHRRGPLFVPEFGMLGAALTTPVSHVDWRTAAVVVAEYA
jgi:hypothetical protein